jgi:hypothetical protein
MLETDKAWFAGIIDGEGCISLYKRAKHFVPSVKITNTNELLINKCKQILSDAGIEYCLSYSDRGERKNAKPAWILAMESRPRVIAVLNLIYPYLVSKKTQADLVLDWCSESKRKKLDTESNYIENIRHLNLRGRVK